MYEAPDYTSAQPWPYKNEKNNDIYSKARISTAISLMDINPLSATLKISKRKLIHFNISLLSGIIKKIKNAYQDFLKNEESLYHEIFSPIKHQSEMDASVAKDIEMTSKITNGLTNGITWFTFSSRNQMLDTYVIRRLWRKGHLHAGEVLPPTRPGKSSNTSGRRDTETAGSRPHRPNGWIQLQRTSLPEEKRRGTQEKASAKNTGFCPAASRNANK